MDKLKELLNITKKQELLTTIRKPKFYNKVKDNVLLKENMNFMADLLFLPTTKKGFKYAFVIVDLASDEFDIEPLDKKEPLNIVKAVEKIKKRKYIQLLKDKGQSLRVDSGTEFRGTFKTYLYEHSILLRVAQPNRHIQVANVERLNSILGKLFNGYLNSKEEETGKTYREWTDVIDIIRTSLNEIRKKKLPDDIYTYIYPEWNAQTTDKKGNVYLVEPKYKVDDLVYVVLETPEDTLGNKLYGNFRNGDYRLTKEPHKILKVLYYHGKPFYRYIVNGFSGVSYQEDELKPAQGETHEKFKVKEIIGKKTIKKQIYYKIWWKGYLKKDATWELKKELLNDIPDLIESYENTL